MKSVLNISKKIDIGSRFNNFSLRKFFKDYGWKVNFASWSKPQKNIHEIEYVENTINNILTNVKTKLSKYTGDVDGYYTNAKYFKKLEAYKEADLLHLHIIHEHYLSLKDWEELSHMKPVVWTWHDPYPLHGHCLHSFECTLYQTGCQRCPHLNYHFEIYRDRSAKNLEERAGVIKKINPLVIVASEWMREKINSSILKNDIRVKVLPFGLDIPSAKENITSTIRSQLQIPEENIVIGMRAQHSQYKGMELIKDTLEKLSKNYPKFPLTVVTFEAKSELKKISDNYQVIDLGWVSGDEIHQYYSIMDFFLMPSRAESFGLMAVEAMVNGAYPLVTHGTALESLMVDDDFKLVAFHTLDDFYRLLVSVLLNIDFYRDNKKSLIRKARKKYSHDIYLEQITNIYCEEYARFHNI